jgi:hypothetical protein
MAVQVNVIYFPRVSTYLTINYIIIYLWLYFDYFQGKYCHKDKWW